MPSVAPIIITPTKIKVAPSISTAIARKPFLMLMLCMPTSISSLPRKPDQHISTITANVVVLIPPPVLHGDEPINIIIADRTIPAGESFV